MFNRRREEPVNLRRLVPVCLYNHLLSPLRVVIEHAHSGIKRLRMVADTLRLRGEWVRDTVVIVVACDLHNLCVISPHRVYLAPTPAKFTNQSR